MNPIFSHTMDVRWREMDALGHVNNAQYLSYVKKPVCSGSTAYRMAGRKEMLRRS